MTPTRPSASIIVPTYREAANLESLVDRVFASLRDADITAEMIIVDDDSNDGSEALIVAMQTDFPVRIVVRRDERGLSSAVIRGFEEASSDRFLVMDADLQHPPELVPALLERLEANECKMVVGTRYGSGGGIEADWPWYRRIVSRVATLLARPLTSMSDPMSGFFALRRATWERSAPLDPIGYKIGLELAVKAACTRIDEVPIRFATRMAGDSKLSYREQIRYLRHLWRLYRFRYPRLITLGLAILVVSGLAGLVLVGQTWVRS